MYRKLIGDQSTGKKSNIFMEEKYMDDKKNKKYVIPEAEVIDFAKNDIITLSGADSNNGGWVGDDNTEVWG